MSDLWKPILGYEGIYSVSNNGCVRSEPRMSRNNHPFGGHNLKPIFDGKYEYVNLAKDGRAKKIAVHAIVCAAFHGPRPSACHQVAHWDGHHRNNRSANLRWATPKENHDDQKRHGTAIRGERARSKLTAKVVTDIRREYFTKSKTYGCLVSSYKISEGYLYQILRGSAWKHIPFPDGCAALPVRNPRKTSIGGEDGQAT